MAESERADIRYPQDGHHRYRQVEDDSFRFRHRNRCILAALQRFHPPGKLYDVGGGNGFVARALQNAGLETALVEPGAVGAENARRLGIEVVIHSTIEEADLGERALPAIGIFDVLEHIEDDDGFLRTLHRFLSANGRLYSTVPAYPLLWSVEDEYAGYFFSLLPIPIWLFRSLPSRLAIRREAGLQQARREHAAGWGALVDRAWAWASKAIAARRRIPFGGSVLCVARPAVGGA